MENKMQRNILFEESGFSLLEMMMSMALSLVVLAGVMNLFNNQRRVYSVQEQVSEMDQNVRSSMDFIVSKIRMTGYDPTASNNFGFTDSAFKKSGTAITNAVTLYFTRDSGDPPPNGASPANGVLDNNINERFSFYLSGTDLLLGNIDSGTGVVSGGTLLSSDIDLFNILYTYEDGTTSIGDDEVVATTDDVLPNDASVNGLNDIKSITITIRGRTSGSDPNYTNPIDGSGFRKTTHLTTVTPRNLDSVLLSVF